MHNSIMEDKVNALRKPTPRKSYKRLTQVSLHREHARIRKDLTTVGKAIQCVRETLEYLEANHKDLVERKWEIETLLTPVLVVPTKQPKQPKPSISDEDLKLLQEFPEDQIHLLRKATQ